MEKRGEVEVYSKSDMDAAQLAVMLTGVQDRVLEKDKTIQRKNLLIFALLLGIVGVFVSAVWGLSRISDGASMSLREQRDGFYSISMLVKRDSPTYSERLTSFYVKGKKVVLDFYDEHRQSLPRSKRMTNDEIDRLLRAIFKYSEQYMVDPWLPMAFIECESWFVPSAISDAGAVGLYQFMPFTAKSLLGANYTDGWERNLELVTEAWFRHYLVLNGEFKGDLRWIAAAYVAGDYFPGLYYRSGKSFDDYQKFFDTYSPRHAAYMSKIASTFERMKSL